MTAPAPDLPALDLPALDLPSMAARTEALLRSHVPLSLLLDLAEPRGPRSDVLYGVEAADLGWLRQGGSVD